MASKIKIVQRLVDVAPAIIASWAKNGGRCILATKVGIRALQEFNIVARPLSVRTVIHNRIMLDFLAKIDREQLTPTKADWQKLKDEGGWTVDVGDRTAPGPGWAGHVVVHVPDLQVIVDLDLQALHRPHKDIHLAPAAVFQWPTGSTVREYVSQRGFSIGIKEEPFNQDFRDAKDWTRTEDDHIGLEIARAIRKAK